MPAPLRPDAEDQPSTARPNRPERRRHVRWSTEESPPPPVEEPTTSEKAGPSPIAGLRALWRYLALPWQIRDALALTPGELRLQRLPGIIRDLEAVLGELDAISAWREAADVSLALERLKGGLAEDERDRRSPTRAG